MFLLKTRQFVFQKSIFGTKNERKYLNLTKNSSLAIAIGYMDVVATVGGITLMQTGKEMETMIIVLLTYLFFSLIISAFMNWFNRRMALVER